MPRIHYGISLTSGAGTTACSISWISHWLDWLLSSKGQSALGGSQTYPGKGRYLALLLWWQVSVLNGEALHSAITPPASTVVVRVMCTHVAVLCSGCGPFTWSLTGCVVWWQQAAVGCLVC